MTKINGSICQNTDLGIDQDVIKQVEQILELFLKAMLQKACRFNRWSRPLKTIRSMPLTRE